MEKTIMPTHYCPGIEMPLYCDKDFECGLISSGLLKLGEIEEPVRLHIRIHTVNLDGLPATDKSFVHFITARYDKGDLIINLNVPYDYRHELNFDDFWHYALNDETKSTIVNLFRNGSPDMKELRKQWIKDATEIHVLNSKVVYFRDEVKKLNEQIETLRDRLGRRNLEIDVLNQKLEHHEKVLKGLECEKFIECFER